MRPLLSRSLCLAVLLVFPAGAGVVGPAPLAPALGMVQSVPAFQASVLEQVQLLSSLSGQPAAALSLSPLTAVIAAPTPASDPPGAPRPRAW